jgi:hypothetical protein
MSTTQDMKQLKELVLVLVLYTLANKATEAGD